MNLKDYKHPKGNVPNFHADDYVEVDREIKDGWTCIYYKNSGGRIRIKELPPEGSGEIPNLIYPGGGCSFVKGTLFCSFGHIDWQIPPKKE